MEKSVSIFDRLGQNIMGSGDQCVSLFLECVHRNASMPSVMGELIVFLLLLVATYYTIIFLYRLALSILKLFLITAIALSILRFLVAERN